MNQNKLVDYLQQVKNEIINDYTIEISKEAVKKIWLSEDGTINLTFCEDGESTWNASLQAVILDDKGETTGYWVYTF
jgi:hypothetical protein